MPAARPARPHARPAARCANPSYKTYGFGPAEACMCGRVRPPIQRNLTRHKLVRVERARGHRFVTADCTSSGVPARPVAFIATESSGATGSPGASAPRRRPQFRLTSADRSPCIHSPNTQQQRTARSNDAGGNDHGNNEAVDAQHTRHDHGHDALHNELRTHDAHAGDANACGQKARHRMAGLNTHAQCVFRHRHAAFHSDALARMLPCVCFGREEAVDVDAGDGQR
eukprot:353069-Chlamydomonas_euryale.AAC.26